jgi:hypothetical protein
MKLKLKLALMVMLLACGIGALLLVLMAIHRNEPMERIPKAAKEWLDNGPFPEDPGEWYEAESLVCFQIKKARLKDAVQLLENRPFVELSGPFASELAEAKIGTVATDGRLYLIRCLQVESSKGATIRAHDGYIDVDCAVGGRQSDNWRLLMRMPVIIQLKVPPRGLMIRLAEAG